MPLALTTYASNGSAPLSIAQIDGNWTAIVAAFNALALSAVPALSFALNTAGTQLVVSVAGSPVGSFTLPSSPLTDVGNYAPGTTYTLGQFFTAGRSTYRVAVASYYAISISDDLTNGFIAPLALGGGPGYVYQGVYNPLTAYSAGDAVIPATGSSDLWVLTASGVAAGTAPPSAPWGLSAIGIPLASSKVHDATQGVNLDAWIAAAMTGMGNMHANIAAINAALGAAHVGTFPLTLL